MSFEFLVKLDNQLSGPAADAQSSIDRLTSSIRKLQAEQIRNKVGKETFGGVFPPSVSQQSALLRATRLGEMNQRDYYRNMERRGKAQQKEEEKQNDFHFSDVTKIDDAIARRKEARQQRFWARQATEEKRQNSFGIVDNTEKEERQIRRMGVSHSQALEQEVLRRAKANRIAAAEERRQNLFTIKDDTAHKESAIRKIGLAQIAANRERASEERKMTLLHIKALAEDKKRYEIDPIDGQKVRNGRDPLTRLTGLSELGLGIYIAKQVLSAVETVAGSIYTTATTVWDRMIPAITARQQGKLGLRGAYGMDGANWGIESYDLLSRQMGRPIGEFLEQASQFGNIGATKEQGANMALAISDAKVLGLEYGKLNSAFEQMLSQPVLNIRAFKGTLTGVVDESKLWLQLAKDLSISTGKTVSVAQANWLVQHKWVSGQQGVQALLETLQAQQGGALGDASKERAMTTWEGQTGRFSAQIDHILGKVGDSKGWETFTGAFNNLITALEDSKVQVSITKLADSIGMIFAPFTGPTGLVKIENFFTRFTNYLDATITTMKLFLAIYSQLPFVPHPELAVGLAVNAATAPVDSNTLDDRLSKGKNPSRADILAASKIPDITVSTVLHFHGPVGDPHAVGKHVQNASKVATHEALHEYLDHLNDEQGGNQE